MGKKYEGETVEFVCQKYKVERNTRGFIIKSINDPSMQLGTMFLACKLMHKWKVSTVPAYVIQLAGQCGKGVYFNWAQYLCDKFFANVRESQDLGRSCRVCPP